MDRLKMLRESSRVILKEHVLPLPGKVMTTLDVNPNDAAFALYIGAVSLLIVIFHHHLTLWPYYLLANVALLFTAFVIHRASQVTLWNSLIFMRDWYPALSFTFLYVQAGALNQLVFNGYWDPWFANADLAIFGTEPGIWMHDTFGGYWTSEILHACYFSYYVIPTLLGLLLYFQRDRSFYRAMFGFSVTFYVCYFLYVLLPVAGPLHLREGRLDNAGFFVYIMNLIYDSVEKPGAAFPSSHVAIAMLTLFYSWKLKRKYFWIVLPVIIGLIISTVYGFYHYGIDVIAGMIVAGICYRFSNNVFDRYAGKYFPRFVPSVRKT